MPCTYTGPLDGDTIHFQKEELDRRERYLCALCTFLSQLEQVTLDAVLVNAAQAADGVEANEILEWWREHQKMDKKTFVVPGCMEVPSEEFVDALHTLTIDWDGDPDGLTFHTDAGDLTARPGDTVIIESPEKVWIKSGKETK